MKLAIVLFDQEDSVILADTSDMPATKVEAEQQVRNILNWMQHEGGGAKSYFLAGKQGQTLKSKIDKDEAEMESTVRTVVRWFDYE